MTVLCFCRSRNCDSARRGRYTVSRPDSAAAFQQTQPCPFFQWVSPRSRCRAVSCLVLRARQDTRKDTSRTARSIRVPRFHAYLDHAQAPQAPESSPSASSGTCVVVKGAPYRSTSHSNNTSKCTPRLAHKNFKCIRQIVLKEDQFANLKGTLKPRCD